MASFDLHLISKLTSDTIKTYQISLQMQNGMHNNERLFDEIYRLNKNLDEEDYQLYWRYSMEEYFAISDYISYLAAITLSGERKIYMLINDYGEIWEDNISFLEELDAQELAEKRERERDIYDVRIPGRMEADSFGDDFLNLEDNKFVKVVRDQRTDLDILKYSSRNMPKPKYFQNDLRFKSNLIDDLKLGYPKRRPSPSPVTEEISFRTVTIKSKENKVSKKKSIKSKKSKSSTKKKSFKGKK